MNLPPSVEARAVPRCKHCGELHTTLFVDVNHGTLWKQAWRCPGCEMMTVIGYQPTGWVSTLAILMYRLGRAFEEAVELADLLGPVDYSTVD